MNILRLLLWEVPTRIGGFFLSWTLYLLGELAYSILELNDDSERWCMFWYPVYNNLMIWSSWIQDLCDAFGSWWPWTQPADSDPEEDDGL